MSSTIEHIYSIQSGRNIRNNNNNNPETPYSAVSSFNFPVIYDNQLNTPVSISASPSMPRTTSSPPVLKEGTIKMSPTTISPTYQLGFADDDGFGGSRYNNEPMKYKESSNALHVATPDSAFPVAPYVCPTEPYFGMYGVSGTGSSRASVSSPPIHPHQSPVINSAGGFSNDSRSSRQPTPGHGANYRPHNSTPILIAPHPDKLRRDSGCHRQNSLQSNQSHTSTPRSQGPPQGSFSHHSDHRMNSLPSSGSRKRKSPDSGLDDEFMNNGQAISSEEQLLLHLCDKEQLPWKDVANRFNDETGKSMKVPALQMRKKRLLERLKEWNHGEERALTMAMEDYEAARWDHVTRGMLSHGSTERWTKEAAQRKWYEMHPESPYRSYVTPDYEYLNRHHQRQSIHSYQGTNNYQLQQHYQQHQQRDSYSSEQSNLHDDRQQQHHQQQQTPQLPPSHPLHILQQVTRQLPPRTDIIMPSLALDPLSQQTLTHNPSMQPHMRSSPILTSNRNKSPTIHSGISTVTMDEVRTRAGSDSSSQMAVHQQQAQIMFEQQRQREDTRTKALRDINQATQNASQHQQQSRSAPSPQLNQQKRESAVQEDRERQQAQSSVED